MKPSTVTAALLALTLILGAGAAQAGCNLAEKAKSNPHAKLPAIGPEASPAASIVGTWHVYRTIGGKPFNEAFDQWHSDGTEFEFANIPPASADVCMGEYAKVGSITYSLYHTGWTFDLSGNLTGTMVLTEHATLHDEGNSFHGPFELQLLDTTGKLLQDFKGDLTAVRVAAPTS